MALEALGGISSVLQIFKSCTAGYRAFQRVKERQSDSSALITKLQIEDFRLESWGKFWGFTEGVIYEDLAQDTAMMKVVLKTLEQIERTMKDTASLSTKYGLVEEMVDLHVDELLSPSPLPIKKKRQTLSTLSTAIKQNCFWVIEDRENFECFVKDLKEFNDGLYNITLPVKERRSLTNAVVCRVMDTQNPSSHLDLTTGESEELYQALHAINSFRSRSTEARDISVRIDKDSVTLPSTAMQKTAQHSIPSIGIYNGTPVLLEWRGISHNTDSRARIASLASLLALPSKPSNFRVLDLVGYYEDTTDYRLCFVSRLPAEARSVSLPPINLYSLITLSKKLSIPPLGDRFCLAQILARSVLQLHAAGWLHRRIRSEMVLFFRNGESQGLSLDQVDLSSPYITGFGYAYPDGFWMQPRDASHSTRNDEHDLYRHPDSHTGVYRREYDIYALGMLLLEIGLWTRLRSLSEGLTEGEDFLTHITLKYVPMLSYKCGSIYEKVVNRCLKAVQTDLAMARETSFWVWEDLKHKSQGWLYWEVIKDLEKCRA